MYSLFSGGVEDKYGKIIFVINEQGRNTSGSRCAEFTQICPALIINAGQAAHAACSYIAEDRRRV